MPLNLPVGAREEMGLRKRAPAAAAPSTTASSDGGPSKKPVSPLMAVANLFDGLTENQQTALLAVCRRKSERCLLHLPSSSTERRVAWRMGA